MTAFEATEILTQATSLKGLFDAMRETYEAAAADDRKNIDWSALPTFGGEEIEQPYCVWSWDAENIIIGESVDDLRIMSRTEYAERLAA